MDSIKSAVEEDHSEQAKFPKNKLKKIIEQDQVFHVTAEDQAEKSHWIRGTLLAVAGIGTALLLSFYVGKVNYYRGHFFPGTTINDIDCGGLTLDEAQYLIEQRVEDYTLTIRFRGGTKDTLEGKTFDYRYVSDGSLEKAQDDQNPFLWVTSFWESREYRVGEDYAYDQQKLESAVKNLRETAADSQVSPTDAYVDYRDGSFVIVKDTQGSRLKLKKLCKATVTAVSRGKETVSVEGINAYAKPKITADNPDLIRQRDQLNDYAGAHITYKLPTGKAVLDGTTIKEWLTRDEQGSYIRDDEVFQQKIAEYVQQLADNCDTLGKPHVFVGAGDRTIEVNGGSYGWVVDVEAETQQLTDEIYANETVKREPVYSSRETYKKNGGLGNTFIEIDLTAQHLWYHKDGAIAVESDVVSGTRTVAAKTTPPGVYTMYYKQQDRVLNGENNEYHTLVHYWMPFNGGIGLHDAYWRGSFGGSIYMYSGSHGCINLPSDVARLIYSLIDETVPIVCYYTD